MGPKREHQADPGSHTPDFKKKRLCELQATSLTSEYDTEAPSSFEMPFNSTIPVDITYDIEPSISEIQPSQIGTEEENAVLENSFLADLPESEATVAAEVQSQNIFPSASDDTTSMTLADLISQTPDSYIEIREESSPLVIDNPLNSVKVHEKIQLNIQEKPTTSDKPAHFRFMRIGGIPILIRSQPENGDGLMHVTDLSSDGTNECVEDEVPESDGCSDSWENEFGPLPPSDHSGTENEANDPAGPTDTCDGFLDSETGLFVPARSNDDSPENLPFPQVPCAEDSPENLPVPQVPCAEDLGIRDEEDALPHRPPVSNPPKQVQRNVETKSKNKVSPDNSLDRTESPSVTASMLLTHSLTSGFWTDDQKNDIIVQTIPLSRWDYKRVKSSDQIFLQEFDFTCFPWLCESPEMERFFCWPCLLFAPPDARDWSVTTGTSCEQDFEEALVDHQITLEHINAESTYETNRTAACFSKKERNLETCQKLWNHFVRTICLEKKEKNKLEFENNPTFAAEVQNIIKTIFRTNLSSANVVQLCDKILNFTTRQLRVTVIDDVLSAQYLALHLEDLSGGVDDMTWIAVIARYAAQSGSVIDRVVDFVRTYPTPQKAEAVINWIKHVFTDYRLSNKVVGFSYSASFVLPDEIPSFHTHVLKLCPRVMFFHSPCDNLHTAMIQAISRLSAPYSRRFFQEAQELGHFVDKNRSLIESVEITDGYVKTAPLPKTPNDHFAADLSSCYSTLLTIFQRISVANFNFTKCGAQVEREARTFNQFLHNPQNRLLAVLVGKISSTIAPLAAAIERLNLNLVKEERAKAIASLRDMKSLPEIHKLTEDFTLSPVVHSLTPRAFEAIDSILNAAVVFLFHRLGNVDQFKYTSPDLLKATLKFTEYPIQSQDFIKHAQLNVEEMNQLRDLITSPHSPGFIENKNHTELLNHLTQQRKTDEYTGLYRYLLFVHTLSFARTGQKRLIESIHSFIQDSLGSCRVRDLNQEFLYGFFWKNENRIVESILEDPGLYSKALEACQFKIILENDFDATIIEYGGFS